MQTTILETFNLLERRLARLEFYLGSNNDLEPEQTSETVQTEEPVKARLAKLEARFADLCSKSLATKELLNLSGKHPDLVGPSRTEDELSSAATSSKQQVVLSSTAAYSSAVTWLNSLQEYPVPDAGNVAALVALQPRLQRAQAIQDVQLREAEELKQRSAALLLRWYQGSVLDRGEQWADVEERLAKMEQTVRRRENTVERERDEI